MLGNVLLRPADGIVKLRGRRTCGLSMVLTTTIAAVAILGSSLALRRPATASWKTLDGTRPKLHAHRGEQVLMPENTIPAYELACILGADYVEPDLVVTKDNQLVCYHDLELASGTDVQQHREFDHLLRLTPDGTYDWYVRDFTLAELRTLRVVQKKGGIRPEYFNGFGIPTFTEFLDTIHRMSYKLNHTIGITPELKLPLFPNSAANHDHVMEDQLLATLASYGYPIGAQDSGNCSAVVFGAVYTIPCPPVIIQAVQLPVLQYLKTRTKRVQLLYVAEYDPESLTYKGMERIAAVAQHYVTWKEHIYQDVGKMLALLNITWNASEIDSHGGFVKPRDFVNHSHRLGMKFGVYTIHDMRETISAGPAGVCTTVPDCSDSIKANEVNYLLRMGVDGFFMDNVADSREILLRLEWNLIMEEMIATGIAEVNGARVSCSRAAK